MNTKTFLATLELDIGESSLRLRYLLVANSQAAAEALAEETRETYFGEAGDALGGGWQDPDNLEVLSVREIGLSTFLELKDLIPVRRQPAAKEPTRADLEEDLGSAAKALTNALNRVQKELPGQANPVSHNVVLSALASSWGLKNWQVVKAKLQASKAKKNPATPAPGIDEDVVDQLVDDVRTRGGRHGFTPQSLADARYLAEQSAELLDLDASEADLEAAANRLF